LRHWAWVSQPRCFDYDGIELLTALQQFRKDADQITPYSAADAAVVHLEDVLCRVEALFDKCIINSDLAKLVFDHGDLLAVIGGKYMVQ
jgi:hypothetical protein